MKKLSDKFVVHLASDDLELVSIENRLQLNSYRNIHKFDFQQIQNFMGLSIIIIVEKNLRLILGTFKYKRIAPNEKLIASQIFNTDSIDRFNFTKLEILDFNIAESAWARLGFKSALRKGIKALLSELNCNALVFHYYEILASTTQALEQIKNFPFYSSVIYFTDRLNSNPSDYEPTEIPLIIQETLALPHRFLYILELGIEIWSSPIVNEHTNELTLILGQISSNILSQLNQSVNLQASI